MIGLTKKMMLYKSLSAALVLLLGSFAGSVWGGTIFATGIVDSTSSNFPATNVLGEPDSLVANFFPEQGLPGYVIVSFDSAFDDQPGNDIVIYVKDWSPGENEQFRVLASDDGANFSQVGLSGTPTGAASPVVTAVSFDLAAAGLSKASYIKIENLFASPDWIGPDIDAISALYVADVVSVDFSDGIGPSFSVFQERDFWNVTTDATGLRISKPADDGSTYSIEDPGSEAGLLSTFTLDGDFSITVDYDWNFVQNPTFSGGNSALTLQIWSPSDPSARFWLNNFRNWTTNHGTNFKSKGDICAEVPGPDFAGPAPTKGNLRIERVGGLLLGYATDGSGEVKLIATYSCGLIAGPMTVVLTAWQVQSTSSGNFSQIDPRGPMDVSFNNLNFTADTISPEPHSNGDVTDVVDVSGDAVPDVAYLTEKHGRPIVRYYSGANSKKVKGVSYLGTPWTGIAAATVGDANANGVANDPAVAVLATKESDGKHAVEVRRADNGSRIAKVFFFSANWTVIDVAIIEDEDGDGVTGDTLIAVLGINPENPHGKQIKVQVKRLSNGTTVANWFFFNGNWVARALVAVPRMGASPLLGVLGNRISDGTNAIQARRLNKGTIQRTTAFWTVDWEARDAALLPDSNGDGSADDPAYLVLGYHTATGRHKVQARRASDGAKLNNLFLLGSNWAADRITRTGDISGNLWDEVAGLATKNTDGTVIIQLKDYGDGTTTESIFP